PRTIERHLLVERGTYPLREPAVDLPVDDHRIDQLAAILDDDIAKDFHVSGFRIDRDHGGVRGIAEGAAVARRFVTGRGLETSRTAAIRQILRPQVPGTRDLRQADGAAWPDRLAVAYRHMGGIALQQARPDPSRAPGDLPARRRHRAAGHDPRARAPGAGGIRRQRGVAEHDFDLADVDPEDLVGDLRQRGFQPLSM